MDAPSETATLKLAERAVSDGRWHRAIVRRDPEAQAITLSQPLISVAAQPDASIPLSMQYSTLPRTQYGGFSKERMLVLRQAADARGLFLSDEVMSYMLSRFSRDLGSLMQLLDHLDHYALQTQRALTIPLVRAMLENE